MHGIKKILPLLVCLVSCSNPTGKLQAEQLDFVLMPPGFSISTYASGLGKTRFMAFTPEGHLLVSLYKRGAIVALPDWNGDHIADTLITFAEGLNDPHGLAWHQGFLYVANTDGLVRLRDDDGDLKEDEASRETLISDWPHGRGHWTRTITFGPDGKLYASIGSSCNACIETDPRRAAVVRYNPDGSGEHIFATGLRNSVGIDFNPATGSLWASNNGRDNIGKSIARAHGLDLTETEITALTNELPLEEINILTDGGFYGWPYAYNDRQPDPDYGPGNEDKIAKSISPVAIIPAHSAPLGIRFYDGTMFPEEYWGSLFIALHGSWNRHPPAPAKIVRIPVSGDRPGPVLDFAVGWQVGDSRLGRPVDIIVAPDGAMMVSDDWAGKIYRIAYNPPR